MWCLYGVYNTERGLNKHLLSRYAMNPDMALKQLAEVKKNVDGDIEELVDSLANVVMLQKNVSDPMYGAKVTLHLRPEGERVEATEEEYHNLPHWRTGFHANGDGVMEADEEDIVYTKFVPEEGQDITEHGTITRRAIVFEADVSNAPSGDYWDPNEQEYKSPDDYPMGTVNVIVPEGEVNSGYSDEPSSPKEFSEHYVYDVSVYTSITPADGDPSTHTYTPGWG